MTRVRAVLTVLAGLSLLLCGCARQPSADQASDAPARTISCSYPADGAPARAVDPPSGTDVSAAGTAVVTLSLDGRPVEFDLDRAKAPCAVNSFSWLAQQGFYTGTRCHHLSEAGAFYLQCGDPGGLGTGGPGYRFDDELTGHESYSAGTVAMVDPKPDHNGSQFFIVTEDSDMPPRYTVIGRVDAAGLAVVQKVAARGADAQGRPRDPAELGQATMG